MQLIIELTYITFYTLHNVFGFENTILENMYIFKQEASFNTETLLVDTENNPKAFLTVLYKAFFFKAYN